MSIKSNNSNIKTSYDLSGYTPPIIPQLKCPYCGGPKGPGCNCRELNQTILK